MIRSFCLFVLCAALGVGQAVTLSIPPVPAGCPTTLVLTGPAGSPFLIAADTGPGPVGVPGLGVLFLDLSPNFFIALDGLALGLVLDASGRFELPFNTPALPAAILPATLLYAQAVVLTPLGIELSNGAAVTLTPATQTFSVAAGALPSEALLAEDVVLLDIDLDGDLDAIVANASAATAGVPFETKVLINQGGIQGGVEGQYLDGTRAAFGAAPVPAALSLAVGDIDLDGDLDVFLGADDQGSNAPNRLYLNQGGIQGGQLGTFVADAAFPGGDFETQSALFGDFDGDGDLDLVLGNGVDRVNAPQPSEFYRNVGGVFVLDSAFATAAFNIPGEVDEVTAGDIDNDGDLDLLITRDGPSAILLNDGTGNFTEVANALPGGVGNATEGLLADFNGDGHLDCFLSRIGAPDQLFIGAGNGSFALQSLPFAPTSPLHMSAVAADFDNDGDIDIFVGTHALGGGELPFLYRNQGGVQGGAEGSFAAEIVPAASSEIFISVAAGDVDGDGDIDLFLGSQGFFGPVAQDLLLLNSLCP